jgi:hypothetical protein
VGAGWRLDASHESLRSSSERMKVVRCDEPLLRNLRAFAPRFSSASPSIAAWVRGPLGISRWASARFRKRSAMCANRRIQSGKAETLSSKAIASQKHWQLREIRWYDEPCHSFSTLRISDFHCSLDISVWPRDRVWR